MSVDLCDVKYGTWAETGDGVTYIMPNPDRIRSGPERGTTTRSCAPSGTKDIEFRFMVPIDIRAINLKFTIDGISQSALNLKHCGLKILTWHIPVGETSVYPNRIFRTFVLTRSNVLITNDGYQISESMRKSGFHMDPCYPMEGAETAQILPEHQPNCLNVDKLKIKLTRLPERSRVDFNKIVILGQPSSIAFNDNRFKTLTARMLSFKPEVPKTPIKRPPRHTFSGCHGPANTSRGMRMVEATRRREEFNMPPEFLDPFTNELMECPMIMPCGKSVDKAYLQKYLRLERKWSRNPNDPFTGKPFTRNDPNNSPKPNQSLKIKIDTWCLKSMFGEIPAWYKYKS
ncbi:RING finger protein 37 [Tetranychus urticae]|uniref:U-box domain-containing protein n=1 Tax=Tetranychus urticae TaxID=32264 RepID=T1JZ77_TETUR|nr:RING finger protein 37 [Tetranychus urticae]